MVHRNLPLQSSFCLLASATRLQHISPSFCELFCHLVVFWAPQGVRATLWLPLQEEVLGIFLFSFQFPPLRNVMLRLIQFNRIRIPQQKTWCLIYWINCQLTYLKLCPIFPFGCSWKLSTLAASEHFDPTTRATFRLKSWNSVLFMLSSTLIYSFRSILLNFRIKKFCNWESSEMYFIFIKS